MASRRRIDAGTAAIVAVFSVPPAVGTAFATLRVTGGSSLILAIGFGLGIGLAVALGVTALVVTGDPDQLDEA